MKNNTRKKSLVFKMFSTSATVLMLCSSVLGPISALAENVETGQIAEIDQIEDTQESQVEPNRLNIPQVDMKATKASVKPFMGQNSFTYDNSSTVASLQNWAVNQGIYLTYNGKNYPFTTSLRSTNITWSKGGYIQVNYTYTFEGQTYSGYRSISFSNTNYNPGTDPGTDPGAEDKFQIHLSSNKKTIEYGTKFNPVKEFGGYVQKENLVYQSIRTYEGSYKEGAKPGNYYGDMRYVQDPSSGVFFNLTAPVTITVVRAQLDEATQLVRDLFKDNLQTELKETTNQTSIDTVLAKVNALPDTPEKNGLLVLIEKAQSLLNNQTSAEQAEKNVNNLFGDDQHTILAEGVTQDDIDAAKELVNQVTDETKKEELLKEIQKAQELLNGQETVQKAEEAVNNLFGDDGHTTLAEGVTQENIDTAKELVNQVTDMAKKEELLKEIQKAQELLNGQEMVQKAEEAVNNLFGDDGHTTLAEGVTQENIDTAKELVNQVTDVAKKEELLKEIQKAQELLNGQETVQKAEEAVNNLFGDDEHTTLAEGINQEDIDAAEELVGKLPAGEGKDQLLSEIEKAQELLDKANEEATLKAAQDAVNNLFGDKDHTLLGEGVDQSTIDAAKELVNKVPEGQVKTDLLEEIAKAEGLLNDANAISTRDFEVGTSRYVEGTYAGTTIKKAALEVNGNVAKQINVSGGVIKYWALDQIKAKSDKVFVLGFNAKGKEISRQQVTVKGAEEVATINAHSFVIGKDGYVAGSYTGGVSQVALRINGVLTQRIKVSNNTIKYYAKDKIKDAISTIELVGFNMAGEEVGKTPIAVSDTISKAKVSGYRIGESHITGTYEGDAKYMAIVVNGVQKQMIGIKDNVIKYYAKDKVLASTDNVQIVLFSGNKVEIDRQNVSIVATSGALTLFEYKFKDAYVEGTFTGDIVKVQLVVNGVKKQMIPAANGTVKYYARNFIKSETDVVSLLGLDAGNNIMDEQAISMSK